jgi:hypothetical protein
MQGIKLFYVLMMRKGKQALRQVFRHLKSLYKEA